jgi:hypothetical protein
VHEFSEVLCKAAADIEEGPSDRGVGGRAREVEVDEAELANVGKGMGVLGSIALRLMMYGVTFPGVTSIVIMRRSPKTFGC